jgi:CelD/BcsL family acetyltransferase involved in cellulose biosynthesis
VSHARSARFELIEWDDLNWAELDSFSDRHLFQSRPWLEFLAEFQRAKPAIARLVDGGETLGYFTGLIARKAGMRFLGSPLPGWTTPYMGFNLHPDVPRQFAASALIEFAYKELGVLHLELRDRWMAPGEGSALGFARRNDVGYDDRTFEIDLSPPVDAVFGRMDSACRRAIRKADKSGVTIEEVGDPAFAAEFYDQIKEVFVRQGLVPTYGIERVESLLRHLLPTGSLLLLRARDAEGTSIATGIYPAFKDLMFFWGGASRKDFQHNRPNEALHWHAIQYWKARGMTRYDLGGYMDYKKKYGGAEVSIPGFRSSRYGWVSLARTIVPMGMRAKQTVLGGASRGLRSALDRLSSTTATTGEANGA